MPGHELAEQPRQFAAFSGVQRRHNARLCPTGSLRHARSHGFAFRGGPQQLAALVLCGTLAPHPALAFQPSDDRAESGCVKRHARRQRHMVLAQDGHAVTVLEQAAEFGEIGAGIQLGPNIFKMFEVLGLTKAVNHVAFFPTGLGMNDVRTGEKIVRVPLSDAARAAYGFPYGVIYRADLHTVFLNACRAQPSIILRTNAKVESFDQPAEGVTVTLAGGEALHAEALIGADGLWSRIRDAVVGDGQPRVSGHVAYRAVLKRADVPPELWSDDVMLWGGEKTHLAHYPLRRGELFNLVAVFHSDKYRNTDKKGWNTYGETAERTARFVDAARPMLQYLAQRAGQAIEDAVVRHHTRGDVPAAFQHYQQARYLRTGRV